MARVVRTQGPGAERLKVALEGLEDKQGKVGWFETAKYPDGTPVAYVAAIQEFGYPRGNIPSRPFMRPTIDRERDNWRVLAESGARAIIAGNQTSQGVLEAIGLKAAGDIAKTISQVHAPPLLAATVKARMRRRADKKTVGNLTKPLVDTGLMISTITSTVEDA